jgi:hypothetical protein
MANAMYDAIWQQAMGELSEQLNVEGAEDLADDVNLEDAHEVTNNNTKTATIKNNHSMLFY